MLTPDAIRNSETISGYNGVSLDKGKYRAQIGSGGASAYAAGRRRWYGKWRDTPLEAAQDYCDAINQGTVSGAPVTLKTAGHKYDIEMTGTDPEYEAALGVLRDYKAQKAGRQGYIYLIGEGRLADADLVKIGYSVNPEKRIAELQCGNPRVLVLLGKVKGTPADEKAMHAKYIKDNVLQEWFRYSPTLYCEFQEV